MAVTTQGLVRVTKVQQVKNNAFYLERPDRGFRNVTNSRADVGLSLRFGFPHRKVDNCSTRSGSPRHTLKHHTDTEIAIYLAAFFFFFFFFLASPSSSSAGAASSTTGAGSSALGSSLTATKRPTTSLVLIM